MSQRHSEYELLPSDSYYTPAWPTESVLGVERFAKFIWEPACGDGHMVSVISRVTDAFVLATDLPDDFLALDEPPGGCPDSFDIISNPPGYTKKKGEKISLAERFVRHALKLTDPVNGKVAMLLPLAWDTAKGRRDLFVDHPAFKAKYTLTKRIRWVNLEQKKNGPSQNHAWYVWDWGQEPFIGPVLGYLP